MQTIRGSELDYIVKMEKEKGINIHLAAKEVIGYMKAPKGPQNCLNCRNHVEVNYKSGARHNCSYIGVSGDENASVDDQHICRRYDYFVLK